MAELTAAMEGQVGHNYKLVLAGHSHVGKSSLMERFVNDEFVAYFKWGTRIVQDGGKPKYKTCQIKDQKIELEVWSTFPFEQAFEKDQRLSTFFFKKAHAVFIVYDIKSKKSFEEVAYWYTKVRAENSTLLVYLIGNKTDDADKRQVSTEEGQEKADSLGMKFMETSASDGTNVTQMFNICMEDLLQRAQNCLEQPLYDQEVAETKDGCTIL